MQSKQDILNAIRQTAKENGGKSLGQDRFEKETGIKSYDWGKYWVRFGDAQKEAGFTQNTLQIAYPEEFLLNKIVELARKLGKFPVYREIDFEKRNNDPKFPGSATFNRFGTKEQFVQKVLQYCKKIGNCDDVMELCESVIGNSTKTENLEDIGIGQNIGAVYLFKHGKYYKIGKTNDTVRRGNELKIQLPERLDLIHEIKTDDPSGIEAYWHRRLESKKMNGEWFDLSFADIKAFRRWRKII